MDMPLVLDADGINAPADSLEIVDRIKQPVILTPHPGEMARLVGVPSARTCSQRGWK